MNSKCKMANNNKKLLTQLERFSFVRVRRSTKAQSALSWLIIVGETVQKPFPINSSCKHANIVTEIEKTKPYHAI